MQSPRLRGRPHPARRLIAHMECKMAEAKAKKSYFLSDGTEVRSAQPEAVRLTFAFANGGKLDVDPSKLSESVRYCAMFHGLAQKIGDSYAGSKTADEAEEEASSLWERLEAGEWIAEREAAGPRISLILAAIVKARADAGKPFSEEEQAERAEKLKTDKAYRESCMANAAVKAAYAAIQAERAAEKAKKAAAEAAGAPEPVTTDDL